MRSCLLPRSDAEGQTRHRHHGRGYLTQKKAEEAERERRAQVELERLLSEAMKH